MNCGREVEDVQLFSLRGGFDREKLRSALANVSGAEVMLDSPEEVVVAAHLGAGLSGRLLEVAASLGDVAR